MQETRNLYMLAMVDKNDLAEAKAHGAKCDSCAICTTAELQTCAKPITEAEAHARAKGIAEENEELEVSLFQLMPIGKYSIPQKEAAFTPHK